MTIGRITKSSVDALVLGERAAILWDSALRGFGVKAGPSGSRSYLIQYRLGGRGSKLRRHTIGKHGSPWTPATARTEAERLLLQTRQGVDVLEAKRERSRRASDLGFEGYVQRFVEQYLKERWDRSWKDAEWELRRYAVPILRNKPLPEITRADINAILEPLRGRIASRRKLYAILRRMFQWR